MVYLKFRRKKEAGDRQFPRRQLRRLTKPCEKIGGSLWMISIFGFPICTGKSFVADYT